MAEVFNKIVKSLTEPNDTRCLWIKGNDLYVYINGKWKNWYLSGIQIPGKTAKDLVGCDSNFLHLGATDDTTSYTNITPLNDEGKVPTTYIDKLDSTVQVVYNDTKYEINMDKAIELGLYNKAIEFVDLGLPSGTLWMKCNIGAEKETDYGLFFQWGDTVGYDESTAAAHSTWPTCPGTGGGENAGYGIGSTNMKAWEAANITNDILNNVVDAAYVHTNGKAKIPTNTQLTELIENTIVEWTTIKNIPGCKFTNRTNSSKYIFIPAAGDFFQSKFTDKGKVMTWLSSAQTYPEPYGLTMADALEGTDSTLGTCRILRYCAMPIRPIKIKNNLYN